MRIWKMILVMMICATCLKGQVNYVLNPDIEAHTGCPNNNDQINLATYWSAIDSFNTAVSCIPDYCHTCANGLSPINCVPASRVFWQYPHSGNGMVQMLMYYDGSSPTFNQYRDYLQGRLYKKLTAGRRYCVSFYVCLEEGSTYAIRELSAYLDNGTVDTTHTCALPQNKYMPQMTNTGSIISDTMHWTRIEGSFVANGTEQFITIGNFSDNAHTAYITIPHNSYTDYAHVAVAMYLIDDVSVIESNTLADAGPDKHVGKGDSIYIGRPKEVGLECTWSLLGNSTIIGTGAGIWVKPAATTSYVVTQTLCGNVTKDTVRVEVWAAGVNSINGQSQQYSLSPNPNKGSFEISQSVASEETLSAEVRNTVGQRICSASVPFSRGRALLDIHERLSSGVYFLLLKDAAGNVYTMRFVRE